MAWAWNTSQQVFSSQSLQVLGKPSGRCHTVIAQPFFPELSIGIDFPIEQDFCSIRSGFILDLPELFMHFHHLFLLHPS